MSRRDSRTGSTAIIEDLAERIDEWLDAESRDPEVKASALRALRDIGDEGEDLEMLLSEQAKEEFLVDYLGVQKARFDADTPADLPEWVATTPWADDTSVRTDPLCECNNHCNLKRAQLPAKVQKARSIDAGVRAEKQSHPGHPTALVQGNDEFNRRLARARVQLQTVLSALSSNITVEALRNATPEESTAEATADD